MRPPKPLNTWSRRSHRWGALVIALPIVLVIGTGLLLQVKKQVPWVQPGEMRGEGGAPYVSLERMLETASSVPEAGIDGWEDIDRVDYRPEIGVAKIRSLSHWEIQIDAATGAVLQVAYRRSDLIEALHDGSWFGEGLKLWVFLPVGLVLLWLWLTGIYLWLLPHWAKRSGRGRRTARIP